MRGVFSLSLSLSPPLPLFGIMIDASVISHHAADILALLVGMGSRNIYLPGPCTNAAQDGARDDKWQQPVQSRPRINFS
jgi:hypothetical protein